MFATKNKTGSIILHQKKYLMSIIAVAMLFFTCQFLLKGIGAGSSEKNAFLLTGSIILLSFSKRIFWFVAFPIFVLMALYLPVGLIFGLPTYQSIASILSTNLLETHEFLEQLSLGSFIYMLLVLAGFAAFRIMYVKLKLDLYKNRIIILPFVLISFFNQGSGIFYRDSLESFNNIRNVEDQLVDYHNDWGKVWLNNKDQDIYLLVIGESVRADYMNDYGYPINNTPFMTQSGTSVKGLISGGGNTVLSLSHMLTQNDGGQPNFNRNIIDLANSAGFKTWWISNQGFIGQSDTPIAMIANKSTVKNFTKYGAFNSHNTSDFLLINKLKAAINESSEKRKFIVVHLYGSHPKPCGRVEDYPAVFKASSDRLKNIACYVNSIKKTDDILQTFNNELARYATEHGKRYSMVYFADHGLVHDKSKNELQLVHGNGMNSYLVPLFKISTGDTAPRKCSASKSGYKFTEGIATWAGISGEHLPRKYDLFDCQSDPEALARLQLLSKSTQADEKAITLQ